MALRDIYDTPSQRGIENYSKEIYRESRQANGEYQVKLCHKYCLQCLLAIKYL